MTLKQSLEDLEANLKEARSLCERFELKYDVESLIHFSVWVREIGNINDFIDSVKHARSIVAKTTNTPRLHLIPLDDVLAVLNAAAENLS